MSNSIFFQFFSARWNGLTVADLVFPWFMWIMGVSMVISIQSQLTKNVSRKKLILNILRRSATLFFLGLVINRHVHISRILVEKSPISPRICYHSTRFVVNVTCSFGFEQGTWVNLQCQITSVTAESFMDARQMSLLHHST